MNYDRARVVADIRRALSNPKRVVIKLGLKVCQDGGSYVLVLCPSHAERSASCSVHTRDGSVAVKCHSCGWSGDVLHLVAAVHSLDIRRDFREVLAIAAELAGMNDQAATLRSGHEITPIHKPAPIADELPATTERDYPPASEVADLWESSGPVDDDPETTLTLVSRRIDPLLAAGASLARVLRPDAHESRVPTWARYKGSQAASRPWSKTGHRMLVRAYDCSGHLRSLRAWLVTGDTSMPKRVPPAGYRASGLVLANEPAALWLSGSHRPGRIIIVEGEPDWMVRSITNPDEVVIGILSGSWHQGFAERVPFGCEVIVRTHLDKAGDRYADEITCSISDRAIVLRWTVQEVAA